MQNFYIACRIDLSYHETQCPAAHLRAENTIQDYSVTSVKDPNYWLGSK
jgi:hypothetical protein